MTYTLSWRQRDGRLCERRLALDELLATLPRIHAPATVVGQSREVCGEVLEQLTPEHGRQAWTWYLELGLTH